MTERLIRRLSRNLRSLSGGGADHAAPRVFDIATLGLTERVRSEWQVRQRARRPEPFGLPDLLRSIHHGKARVSSIAAIVDHERRPSRLPDRRLGPDGRMHPMDDAFFARGEYSVHELTCFPDAVFVEIAYRCILKRLPDPAGFSSALQPLREGVRDRVDVLHALATSAEGTQRKVAISGLAALVFWRRSERVRFFGPIAEWVHALVDLRRNARRLRILETHVDASHQELSRRLEALADSALDRSNDAIVALEQSQVRVETAVVGLADRYRRLLLEIEMREAARTPPERTPLP